MKALHHPNTASLLTLLALMPFHAYAQIATQAPSPGTPPIATPSFGSSFLQVGFGLVVVIAFLIAALWLLKRLTAPRGAVAGLMRVIAGTAVGPRERVVLLEVGDTWLVLGVAPGQVTTLHQLPKQNTAVESTTPVVKDFSTWLKQMMERKNAKQ